MRELFYLLKKMGIMRRYLFLLLLRSPFDAFRTWMLAGLMKRIFFCLETDNCHSLVEICVRYGLICTLLFFYNGTIWRVYAVFSTRTEVRLQKLLVEKLSELPFRQVENACRGEWMTKLNSDIQAAFTMMNGPLNVPHAVVAMINTLLSSILLFGVDKRMLVVTWGFLLPHLFINYGMVLKDLPKLKEESQKAMAESTASITPLITEADAVLVYNAGELLMEKCKEKSNRIMEINLQMHKRKALSGAVLRLLGTVGYLVVLLMGYGGFGNERMAFSDVVSCFQIRGSILAGMFMLTTCLGNIQANSVCIKRIRDTLE